MTEKKVTVYHPHGTKVEVTEARAAMLRLRGYTDRDPNAITATVPDEAPRRGPGRPRKE